MGRATLFLTSKVGAGDDNWANPQREVQLVSVFVFVCLFVRPMGLNGL